MVQHYFRIFLRNLQQHPTFTLINIFGLAVGMASSIMIFMFVQHELSYDGYHEKSHRIFRVSRAWYNQDGAISLHLGHAAPPFGPLLKSDFDHQVRDAVRLMNTDVIIAREEKVFREERFFFADPQLFDVFSWKMVEGSADKALSFPDGLVLSVSMAGKYFGDQDPMGQALEIRVGSNVFSGLVRGIMADIPDNSHFKADFFAAMDPVVDFYGGYDAMMTNFGSNNFATYLLLEEGVAPEEIESQLADFIDRHIPANGQGMPASLGTQLFLWPLTDIHLYSNLDSEVEPNSNIEYVYIYGAIALFILLIACINFMNLATARSARRALEVGLRKVMGADRQLLVRQFMGETTLMSFLALLIALLLVWLTLPFFSQFTGKELSLNLLKHPEYLVAFAGLVILVGLISGSYPSLFLSRFQPANVLKGTYKIGSIHEKLRAILVVGQFAISIALIVAVLVVIRQLDFMKNKDLGFRKDEIAVLPAFQEFTANYQLLRDRLMQHPGIEQVAISSRIPSGRLLDSQGAQAELDGNLTPINTRISDIHVSHTFMQTFGMEILEGRDFDFNIGADSTQAFILNESAVRAIGWRSPAEALEKQFNYGTRRGQVIGVVRDFHFESLHQPISPMVFMVPDSRFNQVAVKLKREGRDDALAFLREEWLAMRPDYPLEISFVADKFDEQYRDEEKIGTVFGFFAGLAILISVLGLFGLSTYATEQRTKEIGIRKVLGASSWNIVLLLGKDFLTLVSIGFAIAVPLAWFGMNQWLENFAYSISVSWLVMIMAGVLALCIAAITVSSQSFRAALINPVDTFRKE
ncbi:putative ABC transport system permease protein [Cyclobacterium lianum]|uniref:Putative ABC transport system permease protein n=1 Tax=Cyclobacterium lianum TaxID=388280 RepID=A0A1M7PL41_9BACT|nr:ABC transporter permease [Cyclobacterium lianum]SHN17988.1 putative ABC transport system permease protein [Cyclobacterium lianum]